MGAQFGTTSTSGGSSSTTANVVATAITDETVAEGNIVRYIQEGEGATIGRVKKALAGDIKTQEVYLVLIGGDQDATITMILVGGGKILFNAAVNANDGGKPIYLSDAVAGVATLTAPLASIRLGSLSVGSGTTTGTGLFRPQVMNGG